MRKLLTLASIAAFTFAVLPAWAGNYLFLSQRYLEQTRQVIQEAEPQAHGVMRDTPELWEKYQAVQMRLQDRISAVSRARLFKKVKADVVSSNEDAAFASDLNAFKDALNFVSQKTGKPHAALFPSYDQWMRTEAHVVKEALDQRIRAFETRFGPDSESVNVLEYVGGELFFRGSEDAPSPWEPIARLTPVQFTTAGKGLVTTAQLGMSFYFLRDAPRPLRGLGISNHLGVAAALQYLDDPRLFHFKGKPAWGLVLHLDRKEVGVFYDSDQNKIHASLGYAFQFIPLAL